jgi:branched-chain amino acid transport system ATP-binding protein
VLTLDEPTQGLAPVIVQELLTSLKRLKGQFSMIVVEQNKKFLESLSDRMLAMSGGELQREVG